MGNNEPLLENFVLMDLAKGVWMQLQNYVEIVGCELERSIYINLIEDVIFGLVFIGICVYLFVIIIFHWTSCYEKSTCTSILARNKMLV